jgi:hypothetical protein
MSIILRFFPNGEFSQGVSANNQCRDKRTHPLKGYQKNVDDKGRISLQFTGRNAEIPQTTLDSFRGRRYRSSCGHIYEVVEASQCHSILRWYDNKNVSHETNVSLNILRVKKLWGLSDIGLSDARILTEPLKSRKKLVSMTSNMGRNLRNAVYLLEERYGKEQLSFLTLTLPNLSREGLSSCCSHWDVMVNTFFKWLRTKLEYSLLELEYVYSTEIQPGRLRNRGEYAPHLHIVFRGRSRRNSPWAVSWLDCRNAWASIISRYVTESFDARALENIQQIKKSAARYLSKYLSKGKNSIPESQENEAPIQQLHTQWGGMSRHISRTLKKRIIRFTNESGLSDVAFQIVHQIGGLIDAGIVKYFSRRFIHLGISRSTGSEVGIYVGVGAFAQPTHISLPLCLQHISAVDCA